MSLIPNALPPLGKQIYNPNMPILDRNSFEVISRSPDQTRRFGMRLGSMLSTGDMVGLSGELGSGKTTLVQGIAAGWGSLDAVTSPTFVLVNVYRRFGVNQLFHLDAYRLKGASEALDLDLDLLLEQGPLIIEWAERIKKALPETGLWIHMKWIDDLHRDMLLVAHGDRAQSILAILRKEIYGT
jgi:tRNA threonylcarbamoyladenosine biosynthesis protein TsaE